MSTETETDAAWIALLDAVDSHVHDAIRAHRPAIEAAIRAESAALPPRFVGFLVGQFMRAGFHRGPRAAQADARGIVRDWNASLAATPALSTEAEL